MSGKKKVYFGLLFLMTMLVVSVVMVSGFFHNDVDLAPNPATDVQLQVGNAAPIVVILSVNAGANVDLNPGGTQPVVIVANVVDPNGAPGINLDESTLAITYGFPTGGPFTETVTGTIADCTSGDAGNVRTYTCTLNMVFHSASGTWDAVFSIDDTGASSGQDTLAFTVNQLRDITITTPINFGAVAAGQQDVVGISTTVTNNGNFVVPTDGNLEILSGGLRASPPVDTISSANFNSRGSAGVGDVCLIGPSDGTQLVDGFVATVINNVDIPKGPVGFNTEVLEYCLDVPNVAEESYSAVNGDGVWTIQIA